jgi:hypothetical protein
MGIEQLGAWGDFIGGIAVLGGLVFVGVQLLGANREARAATIQSALQMQIMTDSELAKYSDTWEKVVSNSSLDDSSEHRRAILLFNLVITTLENRYHQFRAGYLDDKSWEASLEALKKTLACDIFVAWRNSAGAATHSIDFLNLIDSAVTENN